MSTESWASQAAADRQSRDQRAWEVAVERDAPPLVYAMTAEEIAAPLPGVVRCAWCGTSHPQGSDMLRWDCCEARRAWVATHTDAPVTSGAELLRRIAGLFADARADRRESEVTICFEYAKRVVALMAPQDKAA